MKEEPRAEAETEGPPSGEGRPKRTISPGSRPAGSGESLAGWLARRELLRGPYLFADYWASVLRLDERFSERHLREGFLDPILYRLGLDRPDLELPRLRHYLLLFLIGPFLLPFRRFRRLGRYRLSFRSEIGDRVLERLAEYELELEKTGGGRVRARKGDHLLADDILDPFRVSGFTSPFYATYKLPLASLTAIVLTGALAPALNAAGWFEPAVELWVPAGFPLLTVLLWLVFRDWITAALGALPVVVIPILFATLRPGPAEGWLPFLGALAGLFVLYLVVDAFFMPRPVPPVLMLYTKRGPGRPFDREEDGPWWLEGDVYWVWRYMLLAPAELNKFWERDWERVELWVRADGADAGALEWVVTDGHYRELWIPYEKLGAPRRLERLRRAATGSGKAGFWLLEVDANLIFHTPFLRAVSFVPQTEKLPVRSVWDVASALWKQVESDDPDDYRRELEWATVRAGDDVFRDVPEAVAGLVGRHLLSQPWRYWRYPLGAATGRAERLYGSEAPAKRPAAADPALQIKGGSDIGTEEEDRGLS